MLFNSDQPIKNDINLLIEQYFPAGFTPSTWMPASLLRHRLALSITLTFFFGIIVNETNINMWIATKLADGTNGFPLRDNWWVERVLHYYGGKLTILIALCVVSFNLVQLLKPIASYRAIVSGRYIMFSWLCSIVTIGILKHTSKLPCPVELKAFGGNEVYVSLVNLYAANLPVGGCFPAAHSSGGYALMAFGFVALVYSHSFLPALLVGIVIGLVYGGAQILRGMHFLSHDFFTFAICLGYAWFWAEFYLFKKIYDVPPVLEKE